MSRKRIDNRTHVFLRHIIPCLHIYYPHNRVDRSLEQIYRRNNWLKRHGYPKRKKPFVPGVVLEWEYEKILVEMQKMGLPVDKELEQERMEQERKKRMMYEHKK